jgi:hypothetical protein
VAAKLNIFQKWEKNLSPTTCIAIIAPPMAAALKTFNICWNRWGKYYILKGLSHWLDSAGEIIHAYLAQIEEDESYNLCFGEVMTVSLGTSSLAVQKQSKKYQSQRIEQNQALLPLDAEPTLSFVDADFPCAHLWNHNDNRRS